MARRDGVTVAGLRLLPVVLVKKERLAVPAAVLFTEGRPLAVAAALLRRALPKEGRPAALPRGMVIDTSCFE